MKDRNALYRGFKLAEDSPEAVMQRFEKMVRNKLLLCHSGGECFASNALRALGDNQAACMYGGDSADPQEQALQRLGRLRRLLHILDLAGAEAGLELACLSFGRLAGMQYLQKLSADILEQGSVLSDDFLNRAEKLRRWFSLIRQFILEDLSETKVPDDAEDAEAAFDMERLLMKALEARVDRTMDLDCDYAQYTAGLCSIISRSADAEGLQKRLPQTEGCIKDAAERIAVYAAKRVDFPFARGTVYGAMHDSICSMAGKYAADILDELQKMDELAVDAFSDSAQVLLRVIIGALKKAAVTPAAAGQREANIKKCVSDLQRCLQMLFCSKAVSSLLISLKHDDHAGAQSAACMCLYMDVMSGLGRITGCEQWTDLPAGMICDEDEEEEEADGLLRLDLTEFGYPSAYDAYSRDPD